VRPAPFYHAVRVESTHRRQRLGPQDAMGWQRDGWRAPLRRVAYEEVQSSSKDSDDNGVGIDQRWEACQEERW